MFQRRAREEGRCTVWAGLIRHAARGDGGMWDVARWQDGKTEMMPMAMGVGWRMTTQWWFWINVRATPQGKNQRQSQSQSQNQNKRLSPGCV